MSAPAETTAKGDRGQKTGIYLYGILPGDVELTLSSHETAVATWSGRMAKGSVDGVGTGDR